MISKEKIPAGTIWEDVVGYSRAVKIGNVIEISGTVAVDNEGNIVGLNNPYEQTKYILTRLSEVLASLKSSMKDVIRTRVFVTDISKWNEIGRAHGEFFKEIKPATTMVEVRSLINPKLLVEIEITAVVNS